MWDKCEDGEEEKEYLGVYVTKVVGENYFFDCRQTRINSKMGLGLFQNRF